MNDELEGLECSEDDIDCILNGAGDFADSDEYSVPKYEDKQSILDSSDFSYDDANSLDLGYSVGDSPDDQLSDNVCIKHNGCECIIYNDNGRVLDWIADGTIDCIIADAPHELKKSNKGGNRNFASYDCFAYTEEDFAEKYRVLKDGSFLVEFVPEENADNFEYLYSLKKKAIAAGFKYYSKVAWKKGNFVANIGKKAKNTEDVLIFTKKNARSLRPDAKRNKAEPGVAHYMSGTAKMLPTNFDVQAVAKDELITQSQKPLDLIRQIIRYVTLSGECILDQYCGSGVVGLAALAEGRNAACIELNVETFSKAAEYVKDGVKKI